MLVNKYILYLYELICCFEKRWSRTQIPVFCLIFEISTHLYWGMCSLWPLQLWYVNSMCECFLGVWCHFFGCAHLCPSTSTTKHLYDWRVNSSTWHMCTMLIWLTWSGSVSLWPMFWAATFSTLIWGQYVKRTPDREVSSSNRVRICSVPDLIWGVKS